MPSIAVDTRSFRESLTDFQQRQIPFAQAKAINTLAINVQTAERLRLREVFTLRRESWADRSIKITHFAKKSEPWARIAISPPGASGAARADILGKFETETEKRPRAGGRTIAIPINARRNKRDIIYGKERPTAFHFRQVGNRVLGDRRTFLIRMPDGTGLILQRRRKTAQARQLGYRGKDEGLIALYRLMPEVSITPDLHFEPTALHVITRDWVTSMEAALELALRTAR